MHDSEFSNLDVHISDSLSRHGFKRLKHKILEEKFGSITVWVLRTWNINRAIIFLSPPDKVKNIGEYCQKIKWKLLLTLGFIPILYPLGLQIIICDENPIEQNLNKYVDKINNQSVVLQSIFVINLNKHTYFSSRTWGQSITKQFQDSIEKCLCEWKENQ